MYMLPIIIALAILAFLVYLASVLFLRKSKQGAVAQETPGTPNWEVQKSYDAVHSATQKASEVLSAAELEAVEITSKAKLGEKEFEEKYNTSLNSALDAAKQEFNTELQKTQAQYAVFLDSLQKQGVTQQQSMDEVMKTKINETLLKFEQNLSTYLTSAEQKSFEAINLELKSARQLIDTYKSQQLALVDENIVAVLERTLSLVTRNKLTLKEQLDLVYEALEKAKVEKFFA